MKATILATAMLALAACGTTIPGDPGRDDDRDGPASIPAPGKPAPAKPKPPPGVTVTHNPDGSISVTIREPRCPPCSPWEF